MKKDEKIELLREAFQLGQQWVHDINNDKEVTSFNDWLLSKEVQQTLTTPEAKECECNAKQACEICAKSKGIDWNLINPT